MNATVVNVILSTLNAIWKKCSWLICLILLVYGVYRTINPRVVTVMIPDPSIVTLSQQQASTIKSLQKKLDKAVHVKAQEDEVIVEVISPDGTIHRTITKKSSSESQVIETSNQIVDESTVVTSSESAKSIVAQQTPNKWSVGGGYLVTSKQPAISVSYEALKNITIQAVAGPKDAGVFIMKRLGKAKPTLK